MNYYMAHAPEAHPGSRGATAVSAAAFATAAGSSRSIAMAENPGRVRR